jgi:alpha-galactosidase
LAWEGNIKQVFDAGFDGLKMDNCGDDDGNGYATMMDEIKKSDKRILVENCNQAHGIGPPRGLPTSDSDWCNMHMFRSGADIRNNFIDTMEKLQTTIPFQDINRPISRPGCWAFPDMLEVGNFGENELANVESKTHFFAWCIISSPLMISFDVTNDDLLDRIWTIISNTEAIAINQAWAGHPGRLVLTDGEGQIWTKQLPNGQAAILFLNRGEEAIDLSVSLKDAGLTPNKKYKMRDIWLKAPLNETVDMTSGISVPNLATHDSWLIILTPLSEEDEDDSGLMDIKK